MTTFSKQQRLAQAAFRARSNTFSDAGRQAGQHRGRAYPFLLAPEAWQENLYPGVRDLAPAYFAERGIVWHQMRHHLLSSQVCCINFLMPYAMQKHALGRLLSSIFEEEIEALPILGDGSASSDDKEESYVGLEWIGGDYLGESSKGGQRTRGANCTSADAVVRVRRQGRVEVWLVEWKYTESYGAPLAESGHPTSTLR